jgi:hypothetical protein
MSAIYVSWCISGALLLGLGAVLGLAVTKRISGILIDERGRYSLTHLQLALWTLTILSLLSGVFFGRLVHSVADPISIDIPSTVLGLLGISAGSAVAATAVKRTKDVTQAASVSVTDAKNPPRLVQIFLVEEGAFANQVVDITKFQGFVVTILLIIAYIAAAVNEINTAGTASAVSSLPNVNTTLVILFGISHGAYVAGKIPTSAGSPAPSMHDRLEPE